MPEYRILWKAGPKVKAGNEICRILFLVRVAHHVKQAINGEVIPRKLIVYAFAAIVLVVLIAACVSRMFGLP